jgi:hypothetical protein
MHITAILLAALVVDARQLEPAHTKNDVFSFVLTQGFDVGGKKFVLPKPQFFDGQAATEQRRILVEMNESEEEFKVMMDKSIRAKNILTVDEAESKDKSPVVRTAHLWFVVHADLKEFDVRNQLSRIDGSRSKAGQIEYECHVLKEADVRAAGITLGPGTVGQETNFTRILANLPNRVKVELIERGTVTQTSESVVIATRTDPAFGKGKRPSNFWRKTMDEDGAEKGELKGPYPGGITYAKVSRLAFKPDALVVEMHGAWIEPFEWFEGADPLGSKLKRAADEGIKELREKLMESREQ